MSGQEDPEHSWGHPLPESYIWSCHYKYKGQLTRWWDYSHYCRLLCYKNIGNVRSVTVCFLGCSKGKFSYHPFLKAFFLYWWLNIKCRYWWFSFIIQKQFWWKIRVHGILLPHYNELDKWLYCWAKLIWMMMRCWQWMTSDEWDQIYQYPFSPGELEF